MNIATLISTTLRKTSRNQSRRSPSYSRPGRSGRTLGLEPLEIRRLLAADIDLSYSVEAKARVSQFLDFQAEAFAGTEPYIDALPSVNATDYLDTRGFAHAEASPFTMTTRFSTTDSGINTFAAEARSLGTILHVESGPELLNLLPPGESFVDVLLTGTLSAQIDLTRGGTGFADQASSNIIAGISTTSGPSVIPDFSSNGLLQVSDGTFGADFSTNGVFSSGFTASGGTANFSIPARLKPFVEDGLTVRLGGGIQVGGLAVANGYVDTIATLDISQYASSASLMDGTRLSDLGIEVTHLPNVTATTPPETTIDSATDGNGTSIITGGQTLSNSIAFEFSSNDIGSTFECNLDGAGFASCASPQAYATLGDGPHTLEVRAANAVGETDPTPATISWSILTAPVAIEQLRTSVMALELPYGIQNGMLKQLSGARKRVTDDNPDNDEAAVDKLQEFINKVEEQRDIRVVNVDAERLISAANEIIVEILDDLGGETLDDDFLALLIV